MRLNFEQSSSRASAPAPSPAGSNGRWDSPIPYIFSGVALMLAVIVAALIFLACSYVKLFDDSDTPSSFEKSEKPQHALHPEMEPRVVVIMAGQTNPTHFAKPVAAIPPIIPTTQEA